MTTEQQLQAIIDAQGATQAWSIEDWTLDIGDRAVIVHQNMGEEDEYGYELPPNHIRVGILEILLDPNGLKAAYGEEISNSGIYSADGRHRLRPKAYVIAHQILDKWYASNGDAAQTIDTAHSLLPA